MGQQLSADAPAPKRRGRHHVLHHAKLSAIGQGRYHAELAGGRQLAIHLRHQQVKMRLRQQGRQRRTGSIRRKCRVMGRNSR